MHLLYSPDDHQGPLNNIPNLNQPTQFYVTNLSEQSDLVRIVTASLILISKIDQQKKKEHEENVELQKSSASQTLSNSDYKKDLCIKITPREVFLLNNT